MKELDLITDERLLDELCSRFEHCAFYGLKEKLANVGVDKSEGTYRYSGNLDMILGLIERLKFMVLTKET